MLELLCGLERSDRKIGSIVVSVADVAAQIIENRGKGEADHAPSPAATGAEKR